MVTIPVIEVLDGIGMVGFALAGLLATQGRKMDPVGVFVATFITAFGGGMVRDIMLDLRPFYWASHPLYVWVAVFLTLFAPSIIRSMRVKWRNGLYVAADAVGLAFFSVGSTIMALNTGANATTSIILGVTTGVFGGLLRDVFLNRTPAVLSDRTPYATAAFLGCLIYVIVIRFYPDPTILGSFCGILIFCIRVFTYYQGSRHISYHWLGKLLTPIRFVRRLYRQAVHAQNAAAKSVYGTKPKVAGKKEIAPGTEPADAGEEAEKLPSRPSSRRYHKRPAPMKSREQDPKHRSHPRAFAQKNSRSPTANMPKRSHAHRSSQKDQL